MTDASPADPEDTVLLQRCADGDPEAARLLVLRHQEAVRRFLGRMLGGHDPDLDDVAQHTFVAALQSAHRFDGRGSARSWLLGIAHHKAKTALRSRIRRRRVLDLFAGARRLARRHAVPRAESALLSRDIAQAVATLDPDRRAVFVLCEVEGHTGGEVSRILDVPEGTVRRWRREARQRLRPLLSDPDPHAGAAP